MGREQEQDFWTQERARALDAKLDPTLTAQRDAFSGGKRKLTYLEGHAVIAQLNRLFGYGGWSYSVDEMGVDEYTQGPPEGWYAGFWALVTLRVGGVERQDVGCTEVQNTGKGGAVRDNVHNVDSRSTGRKGAVTDALKRAARTFGQQLGNGLYDADDDVYAWMSAHSIEGEQTARAVSNAKASAGADKEPELGDKDHRAGQDAAQAEADAHGPLRAEVVALLSEDGKALDLLQRAGKGILPPQMDGAQLQKTRDWLLERKRLARPPGVQIKERIERARTREEVLTALADAQGAKDRRTLTSDEYAALYKHGQTRIAALAQGPLTARAG